MEEITPAEAFTRFKPESCVFVLSGGEKPNGMVAAWHMKCSADPPLFAVALSKKGNTQNLIRESKEFVVAVPNKSLVKEVNFFGTCHGDQIDKFTESGVETQRPHRVKTPLIEKATLNLECTLLDEIDSGDHFIFIGEVVAAHANPGKILASVKKVGGKRIFEEF